MVARSMDTTKFSCHKTANTTSKLISSLVVMTDSVAEITDLATQIATSAEEQSTVAEEIKRNMTASQGMAQTLNSNGEASVKRTYQLTEPNQKLVAIVEQFRLS